MINNDLIVNSDWNPNWIVINNDYIIMIFHWGKPENGGTKK